MGRNGTQVDCLSNRVAFILTNENQSHHAIINLMGVFVAANKQFFIALEEETGAALCMVKKRPFSQETINFAYFFLLENDVFPFLFFLNT